MSLVYYFPEHIFSVAQISNRFPMKKPFEILEDVLTCASVQLSIPKENIHSYYGRRQTIEEHAERIRNYLGLERFGDDAILLVKKFIFEEACRLEQVGALLSRVDFFLKEQGILKPAEDTLKKTDCTPETRRKKLIFHKITDLLTDKVVQKLDDFIAPNQNQ
ncbi:MAG: DUF4158 domain-containing protein [Desulfobacteraceae bacterium]|nr:DUF4158 domain-containing protein [Desulfobacteraceae bacterium]